MRRNGLNWRMLLALLALVAVVGVVTAVALGGSTGGPTPTGERAQARAEGFDAESVLQPPRPAPPLELRSYEGRMVNLASFRGKAVLVTFLYAHCPDECPLIASDLRVALSMMSPAERRKVALIAVSVDPRGDTHAAVAAFVANHGLTGRLNYLVGRASELARVWEAWGVGSSRDEENPDIVNHTGLVYGVTGSGKRLALYGPEFKPEAIVHDVPLLAAR